MAIIKCKMCGGDLILTEGKSVAECDSCGRLQTIPNLDDEKKLIQFERAERLRRQCEFDKAAGIYETIVADFRQEAEAYWGLVLCKFGIEYVDDPTTGKKIPTCHRSSFDSIMDDSDFEQALENADAVARKVYREEAKAIEEIRKGIISVSSNEQPYDIFICYKETDENGDRTLDSVLAQDVYDVLTDRGYRTFFARISLEDKLGTEYEPYIFAALNSAKIMLAVGTDYEYFNAVWVKNEWSRFLKLMAKDKDKHLIPCFKGIDAYDMPKEFARLQAQDLGKVGAIQDLLRGIEKLLPKKQKTTNVTQEKVVVGGSGDNKILALLDRGNIALEDGDWAKADSFFEDVLNTDAKNAQAYLGKTLAQEKCRTIDAFVRKRKDASQNVRGQTLSIEPDTNRINKAIEEYSLPGYVEQEKIRNLYDFDRSFCSDVAERKQQYRDEEKFWAEHKQLARAEQFAVGAVAQNLATEKKALFATLADRVKKAENAEAIARKEIQERYNQHLKKADDQAKELYAEGCARKEKDYQALLVIAKESSDVKELKNTADKFAKFGTYQDSKNLAEHCNKRADEEQAKLDAVSEQQRILREKQEKERKAKRKRTVILIAVLAGLLFAAKEFNEHFWVPNQQYEAAKMALSEGRYGEAIDAFTALDGFRDSEDMILECHYVRAMSWVASGSYGNAKRHFEGQLKGYKNSDGFLNVISGLEQLGDKNLDKGISLILKGNVPIEIYYNTNSSQPLEPVTYTNTSQYTGLATPVNTGYRFVKWDLSQCRYEAGGNVVLSLVATWSDRFLIQYNLDGGSADNPVEYRNDGSTITLKNPSRPGYTFLGWTGTDLDGLTENVTIPAGSYGNREYTANWKANQYKITLNANGGKVSDKTLTVDFGNVCTLPTPTRENYTFMGWYNGDTKYESGTWNTVGDVKLKARWEPVGYKIEYSLDGGKNSDKNPSSYNAESKKITLAAPTKAGYKFLGWYTESTFKNKVTEISPNTGKNIKLYAKWEMATYTITYHVGGGTNNSQNVSTYDITTAKITLKDPSRTGYKFLGWYTDSDYSKKITEIAKGSYGNLNLYAKWEAIRYSVNYNLGGGTNASANPSSYTINDQITLQTPTKKGYKFLGWYSDSGYGTKVSQIAKGSQKDITLYAKWEIITYTITYNLNGGAISGTKKTTFTVNDLPLSLPSASKTDYVFLGWKKGNFNGASVTQITNCENITLYASYMDSYLQLEKYEPYYWSDDEPYYIVKKYSGTAKTVDIPSEYQGYPVRKIGSSAFANNKNLTTVNIPDSVTMIDSSAFMGCKAISKITIPDSVTSIGSSAFNNCTALANVSLPDTLKTIGSSAFEGCSSLASIQLPKQLSSLGSYAFEGCTSLKSINIPGTVKEIQAYAFSGCTNLATVTLNEGLEEISLGAFGSKKLEKLIIPKSVTYIASQAFSYEGYSSNNYEKCSNIVFYCRISAMPSGWSTNWNDGRPIIWGYDENSYKAPTYTFVTNGGTAVSSQTKTEITTSPTTQRSGYYFIGWYDNSSLSGNPVTFPYYSTSKTTLYAKWIAQSACDGTSMSKAYRVSEGSTQHVTLTSSNHEIYYAFIPAQTKSYTIKSSTGPNAYCYLYDADGKQLDYDYYGNYSNFYLSSKLTAGQTYYIKVKPYNKSQTSFSFTIE